MTVGGQTSAGQRRRHVVALAALALAVLVVQGSLVYLAVDQVRSGALGPAGRRAPGDASAPPLLVEAGPGRTVEAPLPTRRTLTFVAELLRGGVPAAAAGLTTAIVPGGSGFVPLPGGGGFLSLPDRKSVV